MTKGYCARCLRSEVECQCTLQSVSPMYGPIPCCIHEAECARLKAELAAAKMVKRDPEDIAYISQLHDEATESAQEIERLRAELAAAREEIERRRGAVAGKWYDLQTDQINSLRSDLAALRALCARMPRLDIMDNEAIRWVRDIHAAGRGYTRREED